MVAYSLGIIAGAYLWRPVLWWAVAGAVFVAAAAYFARRRSALAWALALGAFFLAGAPHVQVRGATTRLNTRIDPYADRQELEIIAHVTHDGRLRQAGLNEIKPAARNSTSAKTSSLRISRPAASRASMPSPSPTAIPTTSVEWLPSSRISNPENSG